MLKEKAFDGKQVSISNVNYRESPFWCKAILHDLPNTFPKLRTECETCFDFSLVGCDGDSPVIAKSIIFDALRPFSKVANRGGTVEFD